jgi:hypothetical protein
MFATVSDGTKNVYITVEQSMTESCPLGTVSCTQSFLSDRSRFASLRLVRFKFHVSGQAHLPGFMVILLKPIRQIGQRVLGASKIDSLELEIDLFRQIRIIKNLGTSSSSLACI